MKTQHHFLAILPLLSILSLSPLELDKASHRSIASVDPVIKTEELKEDKKSSDFPKYNERAAKIDKSKIEIDPELDLDCFSDRGTALRKRIMEERKNFKVDELDKEKIALQKAKLDGLVQSMVEFEVDYAALVEKKAFEEFGQEIAANTIQELKTTIESLLIDDQENDFIALTETPEEPKIEEEPKKDEPVIVAEDDSKKEVHECEMTEKNKILTDQVAELLKQQQTILQTMVSMNQMMLQMNQQQQSYNPFANVGIAGPSMYQSMYESSLRFPMSSGTHIYIYGQQPQQQNFFDMSGLYNQSGAQQNVQQFAQPQPYVQQQPVPYMQMDPRYSVQPMMPGDFGPSNFSYNFSTPNTANPLPIFSV